MISTRVCVLPNASYLLCPYVRLKELFVIFPLVFCKTVCKVYIYSTQTKLLWKNNASSFPSHHQINKVICDDQLRRYCVFLSDHQTTSN